MVRRDDFHRTVDVTLPFVMALMDGLSKQVSIEAKEHLENGEPEERLTETAAFVTRKTNLGISDRLPLHSSFEDACTIPVLVAAID